MRTVWSGLMTSYHDRCVCVWTRSRCQFSWSIVECFTTEWKGESARKKDDQTYLPRSSGKPQTIDRKPNFHFYLCLFVSWFVIIPIETGVTVSIAKHVSAFKKRTHTLASGRYWKWKWLLASGPWQSTLSDLTKKNVYLWLFQWMSIQSIISIDIVIICSDTIGSWFRVVG